MGRASLPLGMATSSQHHGEQSCGWVIGAAAVLMVATNKAGQIVSVLPAPDGGWSTYSWRQDGTDQEAVVGWGLPGAASGISHSIAALLQPIASDRLKSTDAAGSPEQA